MVSPLVFYLGHTWESDHWGIYCNVKGAKFYKPRWAVNAMYFDCFESVSSGTTTSICWYYFEMSSKGALPRDVLFLYVIVIIIHHRLLLYLKSNSYLYIYPQVFTRWLWVPNVFGDCSHFPKPLLNYQAFTNTCLTAQFSGWTLVAKSAGRVALFSFYSYFICFVLLCFFFLLYRLECLLEYLVCC